MGAGERAHPWGRVSPFKMHYLIAFKHQFIIGRPPLGEILYPPLIALTHGQCQCTAAFRHMFVGYFLPQPEPVDCAARLACAAVQPTVPVGAHAAGPGSRRRVS